MRALIEANRLLVVVGGGGVGKTTVSAALALEAALAGKRTAVLTIDPARRLANALGLKALDGERRRVDGDLMAAADLHPRGELHAAMLDMKATADQMVRRFAPEEEAARRIFENRFYQTFSTSLAGTQEYMAIEQVREMIDEGGFDLTVLDTPPAVHALDFLDAPGRLLNALDSRAVNWLFRPAADDPGFGARLLGRSKGIVLRSLDKLTGGPFFDDLATFLQVFSALFDRFRTASVAVRDLLRAPTTRFIVVTAPNPLTAAEAMTVHEELNERGFPFGTFVCNRVHRPLPEVAGDARTLEALTERMHAVAPTPVPPARARTRALVERMQAALEAHNLLAERDARVLARLARVADEVPAVVPLLPEDVHDLRGLHRVGRHLVQNHARAAVSDST